MRTALRCLSTIQGTRFQGRSRRIDLFLSLKQSNDAREREVSEPIKVEICSNENQNHKLDAVVVPSHTTMPIHLLKGFSGDKKAIAACRVNGCLWDLIRPLETDCKLEFLSWNKHWSELEQLCWHSGAHVLGASLEYIFGDNILLCDSPAVKHGQGFFYEGYLREGTIDNSTLNQIRKQMLESCRLQHNFERIVVSAEEAKSIFVDNPFKLHFIEQAQNQGHTSFPIYKLGDFVDLCEGPHIRNLKHLRDAIDVTFTSQATFDWAKRLEQKPEWLPVETPLHRVYGISFPSKQKFHAWKRYKTEHEEYNHVTVGKNLGIFMQHETSPGTPFFLPHGVRLIQRILQYLRHQYRLRGYQEVMTPLVFSHHLWETSGHWEHYRGEMFQVMGFPQIAELEKATDSARGLKPMNCPAHCLVFSHTKRSHHDLPLRLSEFSALHRNEASGALSGLIRVRQFHQDDAHIFCEEEQVQSEVACCLEFLEAVYSAFGFTYSLVLSTRPEKFVGNLDSWNRAEKQLMECLQRSDIPFAVNDGDGAFYGPKIDIYLQDQAGRQHQTATVQLDFQLPERFDLKYIGQDMQPHRPVIIHRAILGSIERMIAIILESTRGHFPLWCSPRQVAVLSLTTRNQKTAAFVCKSLLEKGIFAEQFLDDSPISRKIRRVELQKFNIILVIGDEEEKTGTFSIRWRDHPDRISSLPTALQAILLEDQSFFRSHPVEDNKGGLFRTSPALQNFDVKNGSDDSSTQSLSHRLPLSTLINGILDRMSSI